MTRARWVQWGAVAAAAILLVACGTTSSMTPSERCFASAKRIADPQVREMRLHRCEDMARDERDERRRAAAIERTSGPQLDFSPQRSAGAVETEQSPFKGPVVRMRMHFPAVQMVLAAAPESDPGLLVMALAVDRGSDALLSCQQLQVAAGDARFAVPVAKSQGRKLLLQLDMQAFEKIQAGRPIRMQLCGSDWHFDRGQLRTLERFASELQEARDVSAPVDAAPPQPPPADGGV